jgi:hypothetical protein
MLCRQPSWAEPVIGPTAAESLSRQLGPRGCAAVAAVPTAHQQCRPAVLHPLLCCPALLLQRPRRVATSWSAGRRRSWMSASQRWSTPSSTRTSHSTCVSVAGHTQLCGVWRGLCVCVCGARKAPPCPAMCGCCVVRGAASDSPAYARCADPTTFSAARCSCHLCCTRHTHATHPAHTPCRTRRPR